MQPDEVKKWLDNPEALAARLEEARNRVTKGEESAAEERTRISQEELVKGGVYEVHARNFSVGVWNGDNGFVGLRLKFGTEYLDTEYLWDEPYHGTASAKQLLETLPEHTNVSEDNKGLEIFLRRAKNNLNTAAVMQRLQAAEQAVYAATGPSPILVEIRAAIELLKYQSPR